MDSSTLKPNLLRNILVRLLTIGILVLAVRFAYFVSVKGGSCDSGDFCFSSQDLNLGRVRSCSPAAIFGHFSTAKRRRQTVNYYSSIFQDLIAEGFLFPDSKSLCLETPTGDDVLALKEIGVPDSIGISNKESPPLILFRTAHRQPFDDNTFDFEFSGNAGLDRSTQPVEFASEIGRTLKPGGFVVLHTKAKDLYSYNSFLDLFNCCRLIRSREIDGLGSSIFREIVMKKEIVIRTSTPDSNSGNKCSVLGFKREIIRKAEPLIEQEPLKPRMALKRNLQNVKFLTLMVDISFKRKYVYVDVGARSYGSSIVSWFGKQYPKQGKSFEIYAIEADKAFHDGYRAKKGVTLLPYAAWVRNETLFFEITREPSNKVVRKGRGMGRVNHPVQSSLLYMSNVDKIQGFDFASWLKSVVNEKDFVVVKMDVEGAEFHLIPRLIETGAICLIDEIFLECHYNRWQGCCPGQRSAKYQKTYEQCLELFTSLRELGVLVHQWW